MSAFFLALGLLDFAVGEAWNLHREATGVFFFRLVGPAEGVSALALTHFSVRARTWIGTCGFMLCLHHDHHRGGRGGGSLNHCSAAFHDVSVILSSLRSILLEPFVSGSLVWCRVVV